MPLNIDLTPQLEVFVRAKVASGLFNSASEVVCEALRLMQWRDQRPAAALSRLREDVLEGLQSDPAGELDIEAVKRRGRERWVSLNRR